MISHSSCPTSVLVRSRTSLFSRKLNSTRFLLLGITLIFGVIFALYDTPGSTCAQGISGCQASGSIPIFPADGTTCTTALFVGQTKDVTITMTNTSSTTPFPGSPVAAKLTGNVTFTLACTNTTCATQLPGTVVFVPLGGNGCVSSDPGVVSCTSVDSNHVSINVGASGVALAPGETFHAVATIRVQIAANVGDSTTCAAYGERADTTSTAMTTTDATCSPQATGGV